VLHFEKIITSFPETFKTSKTKGKLHLGLIHKLTTALYTIKKKDVYIITVFDNRSDHKY
jgi:hypothetical protein